MNPSEIRNFLVLIGDAQSELELALNCSPVDTERVGRVNANLSKFAMEIRDAAHVAEWRAHFDKVFPEI
jgi:hypothetical protein